MKKTLLYTMLSLLTAQTINAQNWLLTGNAGTTSTNFLGTTDAQPLRLRTNNQLSGLIDFSSVNANTGFGFQALKLNTGNNNAAFGYKALTLNTTGRVNTALGAYALYSNTTGYSNVGVGIATIFFNKKLTNLVALGDSALYNNNSGPGQNTAIGSKAMYANTTGYYNTALGFQAMYNSTSCYINTAVGYKALYTNTSGESNTAVGSNALFSNTFGFNNTAVGDYALQFNAGGYINTAIGTQAMYLNDEGAYNTALGHQALYNTTGSKNTAVGVFALYGVTTGSNNTAIGYSSSISNGTFSNSTAIGFTAAITASDQVRIGNSSVTSIGGFANWSNVSDGRVKKNIKQNVPGLSFINKLVPVTYNLDLAAADKIIQVPAIKDKTLDGKQTAALAAEDRQARKQKEQVVYTGFVAQQVEKAAKELGYDFSGVDAAKNDKDLYGLRYSEFVVPLVKAVQELSSMNNQKDEKIAALEKKADVQQQVNETLQKQIDALKAILSSASLQSNASSQQLINVTESKVASLEQNIPNPFLGSTTINYYLPSNNGSSYINLYNQSGTLLRSIKLSGIGKNSITLSANELAAGTYKYALVIDGNIAASKQLVLAR